MNLAMLRVMALSHSKLRWYSKHKSEQSSAQRTELRSV